VSGPLGFILLPSFADRSIVPPLCECGHAPRRHLHSGGCDVDVTTLAAQRAAEFVPFARFDRKCPCVLSNVEVHFDQALRLVRVDRPKVVIRHADHVELTGVERTHVTLGVESKFRRPIDTWNWVVKPYESSRLLVLFDAYDSALEFALAAKSRVVTST
jgi:hypothetical protein